MMDSRLSTTDGPVVLVVVDGLGVRAESEANAVALARTPNLARFGASWPYTQLAAAGSRVGLPDGHMGNSEVGHLNLGAGRVVDVDSARITRAIREGRFARNEVLCRAFDRVRSQGRVHLLGLAPMGRSTLRSSTSRRGSFSHRSAEVSRSSTRSWMVATSPRVRPCLPRTGGSAACRP